ncbi:MAG: hypothetical protein R6U88_00150 [Candidatus Bipolaricaulota bacterium]
MLTLAKEAARGGRRLNLGRVALLFLTLVVATVTLHGDPPPAGGLLSKTTTCTAEPWIMSAAWEILAWGAAATLRTTIHEFGHVAYALAAGAEQARIVSIFPYSGRAVWRWSSSPTYSQRLAALSGGMTLCRGLSEFEGPWTGRVPSKLYWLLRLDPFLYVLRSLTAEVGMLPALPGDDVACLVTLLVDWTLDGEVGIPEEMASRRQKLRRLFYAGGLALATLDAASAWCCKPPPPDESTSICTVLVLPGWLGLEIRF